MKPISVMLALLVLTACAVQTPPTPTPSTTGNAQATMTVAQFRMSGIQQATVEGYIVKIYACPPCPAGAMCKPCMGDNIVISDEDKALDTYSLTDKDLIVFTDKAKDFTLGKRYSFTVRLTEGKSTMDSINDVELLSSSTLP